MRGARKRKVSRSSTGRKRSTSKRSASKRGAASRSRSAETPRLAPPSTLQLPNLGVEKSARRLDAKPANTVVYVHGIGNKPPPAVLKCQWDKALFGVELGDRSRMTYWVNRELYPTPLDETCFSGDQVRIDDDEMSTRAVMALSTARPQDRQNPVEREIKALTDDPIRQAWLAKIATKLIAGTAVSNAAAVRTKSVQAKLLPLPELFRRLISQTLTRAFLRDVNDFLFDAKRRDAMEQSLLDRLAAGGGPFIVIAHSQGSMIAYDVLRRLDPRQINIPLFITIGSPLGLQEVQDALRQWTGGTLPFPPCVNRWLNVADRLDPVAFDTDISNDFEGAIENVSGIGLNKDSPRHPHSATGYLRINAVLQAVRKLVGSTFEQEIGSFTIAKDLVGDLENAYRGDRHPTLIQLAREGQSNSTNPAQLRVTAQAVKTKVNSIIKATGNDPADAELDDLRHFVAAKLTRLEVETLGSFFDDLKIVGIWRNARKHALISASTHTIQARPANIGYGADGKGVCWAVLDTGIRGDHPHFQKHSNVVTQWDCTQRGGPRQLERGSKEFNQLDGDGHGTHVAGIIAGEGAVDDVTFAGMAPRASLYGFKVLNDEGRGEDAWIIKALDTVAGLNEQAGSLVVHGVNLSLGGGFDPSVFGCGHTPLCQELRRLWRQGVLVVLAAGNEGYAVLKSEAGDIQSNMDLSIGDPANLDEAIAVGSVHKSNPHTYGISYFSSRGPTADGRKKPDVVAPGEKIVSARHDWKDKKTPTVDDLYVEMSGTSMAAPHVAGLLAAFLSLRREFVGYPDRVKSLLLNGCVDLARDPYMQGAGLPNLIKMLALN